MATKTIKNLMAFGIIAAAVLIGIAFVMSSSASAAVVTPVAGIVRPAVNEPVFTSKVAPRPFIRPKINPFFPRINPFFPRVNPFFNEGVNPFFFNQEGFAAD